MEARLLEAACSGNLGVLCDLFREDPAIFQKLHSLEGADTPLHLASILGRVEFVKKYIELGSITVQQLTQLNGDGYSPFHLASANGDFRIVEHMLDIAERSFDVEKLCLEKDKDGRTALHWAVSAGNSDVINLLYTGCSQAAMEVTEHGENVLHIALKHQQYEALELLIQKLDSSANLLLNRGDQDGNTALHLAAAQGQLQMVEFLLKQPGLDVNEKNSKGQTAMDIISASSCINSNNNEYVQEAIRNAGGRSSEAATSHQDGKKEGSIQVYPKEIRSGIIVMASIVATLTFQVALTPPGGMWQDWTTNPNNTTHSSSQYKPGQSILYDSSRKKFIAVMAVNFQAFFASICTIIAALQSSDSSDPVRMLLLPVLVHLTVAFIVADFLTIMATTTAATSRLFRKPEFLVPLIFWIMFLSMVLSAFISATWKALVNFEKSVNRKIRRMATRKDSQRRGLIPA